MKASKKRERSKTTELRPNNEDLGKNTGNLLIVWQAVRAPAPFSPPSMPFTHFPNKKNRPCGGDRVARLDLGCKAVTTRF